MTFLYRQDASLASLVPAADFTSSLPTNYTVESDGGSVTSGGAVARAAM